MIKVLEKYYGMKKGNRNNLKDLYIFHVLQDNIREHKDLKFNMGEIECLFNIAKELIESSNVRASIIIERLLDILECQDIELYDLEDLDIEELIELVSDEENGFKRNYEKRQVLAKFNYKDFDCTFEKDKDKFMIRCVDRKNPQKSSSILYNNFEQLLCSIIEVKLRLEI